MNDALLGDLIGKIVGTTESTPLERCHAIRNYIGTTTLRYDVANEIGALICDIIIPYMPKDNMIDVYDDDCTEYWMNCKHYLTTNR
jgi:hypothetical protein